MISTEILSHFQCRECNRWWSIGDWKPKKYIFCPHCETVFTVQLKTRIMIMIMRKVQRMVG